MDRPGQPGTNMLVTFSYVFFSFLKKMQTPHGPARLMAPRQPPAHARTHEQINTFRDFSSENFRDFPSENFRDFSGENFRDFSQ